MNLQRMASLATGPLVVLLAVAEFVTGLVPDATAQRPDPPTSIAPATPATGSMDGVGFVAVGLSLVGLILLFGGAAKMLDLKRKREAEAVSLQAQISDAFLREPRFFRLPIVATAQAPFWSGSPVSIVVTGQVPTSEMREAVLRIVEGEAARIRTDFEIVDRIAVVPTMMDRVA